MACDQGMIFTSREKVVSRSEIAIGELTYIDVVNCLQVRWLPYDAVDWGNYLSRDRYDVLYNSIVK